MGLDVNVVGATGRNQLRVDREGAAYVIVHPHPPLDETDTAIPFRQYLTDDGHPTGSNDMRVDGSVNEVEFSVKAIDDFDIYVGTFNFVIADAGATLNQFGNIGALANGVRVLWETSDLGTVEIHEGLTSNFDFIRLANGTPAYGDGNGAFKANNVSGASEAYFGEIDIEDTFGMPWGLRLRKKTNDSVKFVVRDNVTGVDRFDVIALGIKF